MDVLIAPDKFKGTLTASAAAEAIARGWRKSRPRDRLELLPMSDGGDGFGEIISDLIGGRAQRVETCDAARQPVETLWWWEPKSATAVIESAKVIGLSMLPHGKFHPFELDTFGLGKVLLAAAEKGARRCIIGIGGSATNDGGFGMARALGWRFVARDGVEFERWSDLHRARGLTVTSPKRHRLFRELIVAVDVQNKLLGRLGCSRVYGPQKGLLPNDFPCAEGSLKRLAAAVAAVTKKDCARIPGAGAAGGLGFGLFAFMGGRPEAGFDIFADCAELKSRLSKVDLVITGEGALDAQSLMGKGTGALALVCKKAGVPCIALAGTVIAFPKKQGLFCETRGLTELTSVGNAKALPGKYLELLAKTIGGEW